MQISGRAALPDAGPEAEQAEVIAFLSGPAAHGGAEVEQVVTHISRIFLAGNRAWKLKRAVRTNYLDFSTLENRERICRREIEVNANAATIYAGVVPVTRQNGRLRLGGNGEPVEWLVEMRRFDRSQEFDRLEERGALTVGLIEALADAVAALHAAATRVYQYGDAADVHVRIDQIAGALAQSNHDRAGSERWRDAARAECARHGALIDRRRNLGRVRRCHGDLHLGNIVLLDGQPTPFDAIEFNEEIASIDVLYDLALTLSDLLHRDRRVLANVLLGRYVGATRDHSGLALLPLFLSMRGAVQAMTSASRGEAEDARRSLAFAQDALAPPPPPRLVAIGGGSGTGKTTLARRLAPDLAPLAGALHIRSDVVRKRLAGVAPEARLSQGFYSQAWHDRVMNRIAWDARAALRAGASVVLDATFLDPASRGYLGSMAGCEGVRFDGLWLALPTGAAAERVSGRASDASDATAEVVRRQAAHADDAGDWTRLDASGPPETVAAAARRALGD